MGAKPRPPQQTGNTQSSTESSPAFLVALDETESEEGHHLDGVDAAITSKLFGWFSTTSLSMPKVDGKKSVMGLMGFLGLIIIYETFYVDPKDRLIQPDFADTFLLWVEENPSLGIVAIMIVIAAAVVTMVPIGTPLTLGCGYIYRGVYGWKLGIFISTVVSMVGSCLGAVICFLLGRYLMRETVQQWVRKYPLFDAINIGTCCDNDMGVDMSYNVFFDQTFSSVFFTSFFHHIAAKEQGFKIMAMLYLTPVIPLGLVSYMCGTTSMNVYAFAFAKIFALPLYLIYTFMGASAHSLVKQRGSKEESISGISPSDQAKKLHENQYLVVSGLVLSIVMMTLITRHIRRELMKVRLPSKAL